MGEWLKPAVLKTVQWLLYWLTLGCKWLQRLDWLRELTHPCQPICAGSRYNIRYSDLTHPLSILPARGSTHAGDNRGIVGGGCPLPPDFEP